MAAHYYVFKVFEGRFLVNMQLKYFHVLFMHSIFILKAFVCRFYLYNRQRRVCFNLNLKFLYFSGRLANNCSTIDSSANVDVSPTLRSFTATLRKTLRIILPDRVFGRPGAYWITSG